MLQLGKRQSDAAHSVLVVEISGSSQRLFGELCSAGGTLGAIDRLFASEGFELPWGWEQPETSQRRSLVAGYHQQIDVADAEQVRRLLRVYDTGIEEFGQSFSGLDRNAKALLRSLQRDGVEVKDERIVIPDVELGTVAFALNDYPLLTEPDIEAIREHLRRIERGIQDDAGAAIGSSKELLETVCRLILDAEGAEHRRGDDLPALYRKVAETLRLNAEAIPASAKGSEASQRALRSLVTCVQSLAELRNQVGLGHGRTRRNPALRRHAQLAFNATRTVAEFLLQTWHARKQK